MNEDRFVLTDEVWLHLAPHLPGKQGDAGVTGKDNRHGVIAAVALRRRTRSGMLASWIYAVRRTTYGTLCRFGCVTERDFDLCRG
jgi:transposase